MHGHAHCNPFSPLLKRTLPWPTHAMPLFCVPRANSTLPVHHVCGPVGNVGNECVASLGLCGAILISRSSVVAQLFGQRHAGWNIKQVWSLSCIFGSFNVFHCLLRCVGGSSITILLLLKQIIWTFTTLTGVCPVCVGKHVTASRYCPFNERP